MTRVSVNTTHSLYYDYIRVCSIVAVVVLHVATRVVQTFPPPDMADWWFANILDSACRWGVPCFIMLSGSLLLASHEVEPYTFFFKKRIRRIGIPLLFWFIVYFVWLGFWHRQTVDLHFIVGSLISWGPYYHLYFFYIIIPLYCITPLLRTQIREGRTGGLKIAGALFLFLGMSNSLIYCIKDFVWFPLHIPVIVHFLLSLMGYLGYYIAGYFVNRLVLSRRNNRLAQVFFIVACMTTALGTFVLFRNFNPQKTIVLYLYDYFSPTCVVMTFCIFLMIKAWKTKSTYGPKMHSVNQWVRRIFSPATLGIFLVHPIVLDILEKFLPISPTMRNHAIHLSQWIRIPLLTFMTLLLSLVVIVCMKKIPYLKNTAG